MSLYTLSVLMVFMLVTGNFSEIEEIDICPPFSVSLSFSLSSELQTFSAVTH